MNDREREKDDPPSKWRRLKASLLGRKPTPPTEVLTPALESKAEALTPPAAPMAEAMPELKAEPEAEKAEPPAALAPSPPSELPTEKTEGGGKKKSQSGSEKRQREHGFRVRATADEFIAIRERARQTGLSAGAYLRACALGKKGPRARRAPPVQGDLLAEAIAALNRVGNNLNQIAHHLNAGGHPDRVAIAEAKAELSDCLKAILKSLGRATK